MVSAIDTLFHRCMLLFYCKEKGHLSSKSVLNSLFRYGLRFLRHYNSFCNAGLRPYPLLSPDNQRGIIVFISHWIFSGFLFLPCCRGEQKKHREQLQSTCKHIENKYNFSGRGEETEICGRSDKLQTGTDVVYCCGDGCEIRY